MVAVRRVFSPEARQIGRALGVYGLIGVLAGLAGGLFASLVHLTGEYLLFALAEIDPTRSGWESDPAGFSLPSGARWWVLAVPTLGALASGWICARWAPEAMGAGIGNVIDAYHRHGGRVRRRVPGVKAAASALTIGSGGSAGIEGPVGFVTAGLGSLLGRVFRLSTEERRLALMAGFAAGIGAVFHAPMAASILATEVLYRQLDMEHEVLVPAVVASTLAYATYGALHDWERLWSIPEVAFGGFPELVPYLLLAIGVAVAGRLFVAGYRTLRRRMARWSAVPLWLRPAIGGFGVGVVGLFAPSALGVGYGLAQTAIDASTGVATLLLLAVAKMATSTFTAASGGSGGLFAPSLVIGAALGGAVGILTTQAAPELGVSPAAFAVVGMAGFFTTVVSAPLSTVIMVSELAGSYELLVPSLWVCGIAWVLGPRVGLYDEQVQSRLEAPTHLADMMDAVLRRISVRDATDPTKPVPATVSPDTPLRELVHVFAHTVQGVFPIVDPGTGRMRGVVDGRQLRRTLGEAGVDPVLIAEDFETQPLTVSPTESLYEAVGRMSASGYDEIIVVDPAQPDEVLSILSRREVITAYHRKMLQQAGREPEPDRDDEDGAARPDDLMAALERGELLYDVAGSDHDTVLAEMVERQRLPEACDREHLLELLLARERLGNTHIGRGIALPHPNVEEVPGLVQPRLTIGFLSQTVPWGYADTAEVETVCLLLAPSGPVHLSLVGSLARGLSDPALRRLLHERASRRQIMERFRQLEEGKTG